MFKIVGRTWQAYLRPTKIRPSIGTRQCNVGDIQNRFGEKRKIGLQMSNTKPLFLVFQRCVAPAPEARPLLQIGAASAQDFGRPD
jgi:hypothetical protein